MHIKKDGARMKEYFETEEEAKKYKEKHQLYVRIPEYIECRKKWALVFLIKAHLTVC